MGDCEFVRRYDTIRRVANRIAPPMMPQHSALLATLNVRGEVDLVRELCDVHLEPLLHLVQDLGVGLVRHEGDSKTLKLIRESYLLMFKTTKSIFIKYSNALLQF